MRQALQPEPMLHFTDLARTRGKAQGSIHYIWYIHLISHLSADVLKQNVAKRRGLKLAIRITTALTDRYRYSRRQTETVA
eukprot:scaffold9772_cov128-Isochrysis_galbana.AAC.2